MTDLSRIQQQSLTGQIIQKLDAADGQTGDGKISQSIWTQFFGADSGRENTKGRREQEVTEDGIDFATAFKTIMTRIFNAARKGLAGQWQDDNGNLTAEATNKINQVAKEWLDAVPPAASEADDAEEPEEEVDADAQAVSGAKTAAAGVKSAVEGFGTEMAGIGNSIDDAAKTDGKSKEDVEAAKTAIQQKINALKQQIEAQKQIIAQQKEAIKDKEETEGFTEANQAITDAEAAITDAEGKIAQLQEALDKISTEGLKTREQLRIEKREAVINDILTTRKGKLEDKRLINGKEENYYKFKDEDGKTHRVIVDADGNLDELIEISGGALRKKQFITASKLKAETGLDSLPEGIKCKCDADGKLTFTKNGKEVVYDKTAGEFKPVQAEEE